ncbi:MAG TPA: prepilin-type N-terminal cleavage/methylation domain-containing protein [Chromatiaceae bacterium]|nr:prepilin-type N-terminal cleavage/methylation domain-containing protein [Chromatiaceae bacterium]
MMHSRNTQSLIEKQRGVTLVEIMIALTISLFLLAGVSQLYVESKHGFRVQDSVSALEENARMAMDKLAYSIRTAGHFAGVDLTDVQMNTAFSGISGEPTGAIPVAGATADACNEAFVERVTERIKGYSLRPPCVAAADWVTSSDAFVVRFADPNGSVADGGLASEGAQKVFVRTEVAETAISFEAGGTLPAPATWKNGVYNFPYNFSLFFIRPCSTKSGATCAGTDDNGNPIPTLVRVTVDNSRDITQEALIEGIETMKLRYGRDTDGDGAVDTYQTATEIATAAAGGSETPLWNQVQTVQIAIVARGHNLDAKNTYTLGKFNVTSIDGTNTILENLGLDTFVAGLSARDQKYPRSLYTTVVNLRNR